MTAADIARMALEERFTGVLVGEASQSRSPAIQLHLFGAGVQLALPVNAEGGGYKPLQMVQPHALSLGI